ncbi:MAG: N-acetyl-gamma-glutamyl-phosphate reductase [Bacteroidetes bacterium]|nr:N-acetyl-gamma-glutamyl-phosphate reductase [Bacteroidota bacterium]
MSKKIKAGIIGSAGYAGGELIRLLLHHPYAELKFAQSRSNAGNKIYSVHTDLLGETDLSFSNETDPDCDVLFLCMGHGESKKWMNENKIADHTHVIDLSQDFRSGGADFIYGLPELQKKNIGKAKHIANPGCFATAIQLALLPAVQAKIIDSDVNVSATTGSTGAGQNLSATSHFTWRHGNHSAYKVLEHQHLTEIEKTFFSLDKNFPHAVHFIPQRGAFARGIHTIAHFSTSVKKEEAKDIFEKFYNDHPFTHISPCTIDVKQVVNTNNCFLHIENSNGRLIITSVIDNLLKGASGQAVQNMNLIFGFDETSGLKLKSTAY